MHVLVVTCELILAVKAVQAAKLAAEHVAWVIWSFGAMFGSVVSLQITKLLGEMVTIPLSALISSVVFVMSFLMCHEGERIRSIPPSAILIHGHTTSWKSTDWFKLAGENQWFLLSASRACASMGFHGVRRLVRQLRHHR